jgi:hypothetical protein
LGDVGSGSLNRLATVQPADANRSGLGLAVVSKVLRPDDRIFMGGSSRIGGHNDQVTEPHFHGSAGLFEQPVDLGVEVGFGAVLLTPWPLRLPRWTDTVFGWCGMALSLC